MPSAITRSAICSRPPGKTEQVLDAYRQSLTIRERLAQQEPGNAGWQRDRAGGYRRQASVAEAPGDAEQAARYWDLCRRTLQSMKDRGMHLDPPAAAVLAKLEKKAP